jgi:aldose 1-epimerase
VLRKGSGVREAARLEDPETGRVLTVSTDAPAIQFYAAKFDGSFKGKNGFAYKGRAGVCLETEAFPNAPNQPEFPSSVLRPGETYQHTLVFKFSVK